MYKSDAYYKVNHRDIRSRSKGHMTFTFTKGQGHVKFGLKNIKTFSKKYIAISRDFENL